MHVDDLAGACLFLMDQPMNETRQWGRDRIFNIGVGEDITIADLAAMISGILGFHGELEFDTSKPDGTPRKLLDVSRMNDLGWKASVDLVKGIEDTYRWFLQSDSKGARRVSANLRSSSL